VKSAACVAWAVTHNPNKIPRKVFQSEGVAISDGRGRRRLAF